MSVAVLREKRELSDDLMNGIKESLLLAREMLTSFYSNHPEAKKLLHRGMGAFMLGEGHQECMTRYAFLFSEKEEKELARMLFVLRRKLFRLLVRREYFWEELKRLKDKADSSPDTNVYELFEWDTIVKTGNFLEEKERLLREHEKGARQGDIKAYALLVKRTRNLNIRWGVLENIAKKENKPEREIVRVMKEIKDLFVLGNIKLIPYTMKTWFSDFAEAGIISREDLFSEGILALYKAIDKFNHARETKFSTYAVNWIRQHMARAICNARKFRVPTSVLEKISRIKKAREELEEKLERPPTEKELVKATGLSYGELFFYSRFMHDAGSLDVEISEFGPDGRKTTLGELVADTTYDPYRQAEASAIRELILKILEERLSPLEKEIILARIGFYEGETESLDSIARKLNKTRSWVRRAEQRALKKLRMGKYGEILYSIHSPE